MKLYSGEWYVAKCADSLLTSTATLMFMKSVDVIRLITWAKNTIRHEHGSGSDEDKLMIPLLQAYIKILEHELEEKLQFENKTKTK